MRRHGEVPIRSSDSIFEKPRAIRLEGPSLRGAKRRSNPFFSFRGEMDCFASLAMTAKRTFAIPRRDCARVEIFRPNKKRAQGMPGARCTRGLVCKMHKEMRTRAYRFSGGNPTFPAQGRVWAYKISVNQRGTAVVSSFVSRSAGRAPQRAYSDRSLSNAGECTQSRLDCAQSTLANKPGTQSEVWVGGNMIRIDVNWKCL
jgi:hypothetical protein